MKTTIRIIYTLLILLVFFSSCKKKTAETLKVQDSYFAIIYDGEFQKLDEAKYQSGDDVYLFLSDVGEFKQDKDGFSIIELDLEIKNSRGSIIFEQNDLLGDKGKMNLPDKIAGNPYAIWHSTTDIETGKYTFKLKIQDKLNDSYVLITKKFKIEKPQE